MPEPDFDQIARDCVESSRQRGEEMDTDTAAAVAEQLRQVWNARGVADIAAIEDNWDHYEFQGLYDIKSSIRKGDR